MYRLSHYIEAYNLNFRAKYASRNIIEYKIKNVNLNNLKKIVLM